MSLYASPRALLARIKKFTTSPHGDRVADGLAEAVGAAVRWILIHKNLNAYQRENDPSLEEMSVAVTAGLQSLQTLHEHLPDLSEEGVKKVEEDLEEQINQADAWFAKPQTYRWLNRDSGEYDSGLQIDARFAVMEDLDDIISRHVGYLLIGRPADLPGAIQQIVEITARLWEGSTDGYPTLHAKIEGEVIDHDMFFDPCAAHWLIAEGNGDKESILKALHTLEDTILNWDS